MTTIKLSFKIVCDNIWGRRDYVERECSSKDAVLATIRNTDENKFIKGNIRIINFFKTELIKTF